MVIHKNKTISQILLQITLTVLIGGAQSPGLDDEPTDKENKHGEKKQIENIAVVARLRHGRDSRHR